MRIAVVEAAMLAKSDGTFVMTIGDYGSRYTPEADWPLAAPISISFELTY